TRGGTLTTLPVRGAAAKVRSGVPLVGLLRATVVRRSSFFGPTMPTNWYYARGKQRVGPVPFSPLQQLANSGQLQPVDMILQEGTPKWVPAGSVAGLFSGLPGLAHSVPGPTAAGSDTSRPPGEGGDVRAAHSQGAG